MKKNKKSIKVDIQETKNGTDISLTCSKCGEPIIDVDEFGMKCKNNCYKQENIEAKEKLENLLKNFGFNDLI